MSRNSIPGSRPTRGATSRDVAAHAGVSQSAVSRAFTPGASISAALKARIDTAATELGYRPSRLPGMILKGRTNMVAVVVGGFSNPYHALASEALCQALHERGKRGILVPVSSGVDIDTVIDELLAYRVDGFITSLAIHSASAAARLSQHGVPIIVFNATSSLPNIYNITSSNEAAGKQAARLFVGGGHFRTGFVAGPPGSAASKARLDGFRSGLAALGAPPPRLFDGNYLTTGGLAAADQLMRDNDMPDALFCVNDLTAIGLMDGLRRNGSLHLPAIIGFDNIPAASWAPYNLTTFDQDIGAMALKAMDCLDSESTQPPGQLLIPSRLIRRASA